MHASQPIPIAWIPKIAALCIASLFPWAGTLLVAGDMAQTAHANEPVELALHGLRTHTDPFRGVTVDVTFTAPDGSVKRVPAFWAGGAEWKARYASPLQGVHRWRSECDDQSDAGLHGVTGTVEVTAYAGDNPLYAHGPIRIAPGKRYFEHADGTPFFWLGDTWWMGLCHRLEWPSEFQKLAADRRHKGFNVVQIVAGLYPDMHPFDPRGANEAGFPWEADYARIRPEYFDAADRRLAHLTSQGIVPCIVGAWGYFLPWMGQEKAKAHWRYLIARYGSWPVVWCAAGEANLPWYLAKGFPFDDQEQARGWREVMGFIRVTDPWRRPLTVHPTAINFYTARHVTGDLPLLDFDFLQTPHGQREAAPIATRTVTESRAVNPPIPVINGEASYEMLSDRLPTRWTRAMFWLCVMNGAAGHTYGANGIWQCNRPGKPHGASPNGTGNGYGLITWEEAMNLPGSRQLGAGKAWIQRVPWWQCEPHPEWAAWDSTAERVPELGAWIWLEKDAATSAPAKPRFFRRVLEIPSAHELKAARIYATADDSFTVWINGREVVRGNSWADPQLANALPVLRKGRNVIAVRASNSSGPAGLNLTLELDLANGSKQTLHTGADWRVSDTEAQGWRDMAEFDDSSWTSAAVLAPYGSGPWGRPSRQNSIAPCALGQPDGPRLFYLLDARPVTLRALKPGGSYTLRFLDPDTCEERDGGTRFADAAGEIHLSDFGTEQDIAFRLDPSR